MRWPWTKPTTLPALPNVDAIDEAMTRVEKLHATIDAVTEELGRVHKTFAALKCDVANSVPALLTSPDATKWVVADTVAFPGDNFVCVYFSLPLQTEYKRIRGITIAVYGDEAACTYFQRCRFSYTNIGNSVTDVMLPPLEVWASRRLYGGHVWYLPLDLFIEAVAGPLRVHPAFGFRTRKSVDISVTWALSS